MTFDEAEEHLKSAMYCSAYVLGEFREHGLSKAIEDRILEYEFAVWSMLDHMKANRADRW